MDKETYYLRLESLMGKIKSLRDKIDNSNDEEKIKYQARLREKVQKLRGKLDNASIVAYEVGTFCKAKLDK